MSLVYQVYSIDTGSEWDFMESLGIYNSIKSIVKCEKLQEELVKLYNEDLYLLVDSGLLKNEDVDAFKAAKFDDIKHYINKELAARYDLDTKECLAKKLYYGRKICITSTPSGFGKVFIHSNCSDNRSLYFHKTNSVQFFHFSSKKVFESLTKENFSEFEVGKETIIVNNE
jgi:hypothetical protein